MVEFRWVALIALWTFLSGPAFGPPPAAVPARGPAVTRNHPPVHRARRTPRKPARPSRPAAPTIVPVADTSSPR